MTPSWPPPAVTAPLDLSRVTGLRDFYAFEDHVKTCRAHRGLDVAPQWYEVPVFYFSNHRALLPDGATVYAPRGCLELDFELELACVIGTTCRDLPADDRAMEVVAGFTVMNDWSARDLQRQETAVGLGPAKGKDFATSLGPHLVPWSALQPYYRDGRLHLGMKAYRNGKLLSENNAGTMYWTWPQLLARASHDATLYPGDVIGSGTVGGGCILELTPDRAGGWLTPGDCITLVIEAVGSLTNTVVPHPHPHPHAHSRLT